MQYTSIYPWILRNIRETRAFTIPVFVLSKVTKPVNKSAFTLQLDVSIFQYADRFRRVCVR